MSKDFVDTVLPHHVQQQLCTTRLPYRQGRKLTAVKVYTVNNESKHLLVFGVPSLNLRQETKALFLRFGKLLQFNITKLPSEQFTETYHAVYEKIESARVAKNMLDTKNYYGGNLHVCYAPEFESTEETREKLMLRQKHVAGRLKNLQKEAGDKTKLENSDFKSSVTDMDKTKTSNTDNVTIENKMYMGNVNNIILEKRKAKITKFVKKLKSTDSRLLDKEVIASESSVNTNTVDLDIDAKSIDVIDCTSTSTDVITNIDLNYNNFGKEIVKQVPYKPVNRIKFNKNT